MPQRLVIWRKERAYHSTNTAQVKGTVEWSPVPQNTELKLVRSIWDYHDKDTHMCTHTRFCLQAVLNIDKTEHNQAWQEKSRERNGDFFCTLWFCVNRFPIMLRCCCFVLTLLIEFDWPQLLVWPEGKFKWLTLCACKDDLLNSSFFFTPTMTYNYKPWKICYTHKQMLWSEATSESLFLSVDIASQKQNNFIKINGPQYVDNTNSLWLTNTTRLQYHFDHTGKYFTNIKIAHLTS